MNTLLEMRELLAAAITAADIGFDADSIIFKRKADLWNDVATALNVAANGAVLHIATNEGTAAPQHRYGITVTVALTIICAPQVEAGVTPEEELWQSLISTVQSLRLTPEAHNHSEFKLKSFSDIEVAADGGTPYFGRQTVFEKLVLFGPPGA